MNLHILKILFLVVTSMAKNLYERTAGLNSYLLHA